MVSMERWYRERNGLTGMVKFREGRVVRKRAGKLDIGRRTVLSEVFTLG